ncbi:FAD-dependent monooxygenase [Mycobacterium aquaticum]|uniref:FAD-dependent monooxygenase n=1 Tax=Mycobacterium aquaticum TaxID=1927124 RepID=UPI0009F4F5F5|nr:FAD-dependent monooxygenase [Mycobacterium aquaticum]
MSGSVPNTTQAGGDGSSDEHSTADVVPVLIVGAGPVGLALALELAWQGQRSVLVERGTDAGVVLLPKATGLHERTIEMCRRWGIVDRVIAEGFPDEFPGDSVYATSHVGHHIGRSAIPSGLERTIPDSSPEKRLRCPQYKFDPLLARAVASRGLTEIRYGVNVEELIQDADGVTVEVSDVGTGERSTIRAKYVVGCDGAGSTVRRQLGIPFEGKMLDFSLSAMIRVPDLAIEPELRGGERYILLGPDGTWGTFTSIDGDQIWRLTVVGSQERLNPETFDMTAQLHRALGHNIPFEVLRVAPWRRSQCSAATYRVGRVLLAGDAAHTTSPTGGHGLNTGIGDVSDLGWILTAQLEGWGGENLLAAYDLERRPVAVRNSASSTANYQAQVDSSECADVLDPGPVGEEARRRIGKRLVEALNNEWYSLGLELGFRYEGSPVIVPDGTPMPPDEYSNYVQTARPGHRAPHAWLADGRSTLDLFGHGFVVLRFAESDGTDEELERAAAQAAMPLQIIDIDQPEIAELYERRLVLVRPDGHVAWRADSAPANATALLNTVRGVSQ